MFGREKARLQEELHKLQEENEQKTKALAEISSQKDILEEQFVRLTVSNAQMKKALETAVDYVNQLSENAAEGSKLCISMSQMAEKAVEETEAERKRAEQIFLTEQANEELIEKVVEQNKHFTTPVKELFSFIEDAEKENVALQKGLEQLEELSKNMGVLSLNAAIEAGRMGESGKKFISAAEDIRTFSEEYGRNTANLTEQVIGLTEKVKQAGIQMNTLNELLKENNSSTSKVLKAVFEQRKACETERKEQEKASAEILPELVAELKEQEEQAMELSESLKLQVGSVEEEYAEQKDCTDEIEAFFKRINQSVMTD